MPFPKDAILKHLRATCDEVSRHAAAPAAEVCRNYGPGKWTVGEILAHLADCEFITLWRFGRAVAEPGSSVDAFDEMEWARRLDYPRRPAAVSGDLFRGARQALIHAVATLPDDHLLTSCRHPEKGDFPGWRWANLAAHHTEHHLGQIVAAREGRAWTKVVTPSSWEFGAAEKPL